MEDRKVIAIEITQDNQYPVVDAMLKTLAICNEQLREKDENLKFFIAQGLSLKETREALVVSEASLKVKSEALVVSEASLKETREALVVSEASLKETREALVVSEASLKEKGEIIVEIQNKNEQFLLAAFSQINIRLKSDIIDCSNEEMAEYLKAICDNDCSDTPGFSQYKSIEHVERSLNYGNTPITKCASLVWWYEQKNIYPKIKELVPHIEEIYGIFKFHLIPVLKMLYDLDIQLPNDFFSKSIEGYGVYENGVTRLKTIFDDLCIENYTLCEIYLLRRNNKKGSCYVYYE